MAQFCSESDKRWICGSPVPFAGKIRFSQLCPTGPLSDWDLPPRGVGFRIEVPRVSFPPARALGRAFSSVLLSPLEVSVDVFITVEFDFFPVLVVPLPRISALSATFFCTPLFCYVGGTVGGSVAVSPCFLVVWDSPHFLHQALSSYPPQSTPWRP